MKRISIQLLLVASSFAAAANAKQKTSAFEIRPVVTPQTIIDGQIIGNCIDAESAVINDLGDVAFTAYCDSSRDRLFTSHRIVAATGDHIDGKFIQAFFDVLAINNQGQVLYRAFFSDTDNYDLWSGHEGLFLDRHLLSIVSFDAGDRPYLFNLSEDGRVTAEIVDPALACPARGATSTPRSLERELETGPDPLPFARNRRGEFLLPIKRYDNQIFLLLASPIKR